MGKGQKEPVHIDEKAIKAMEHVLSHGDRVELIPVKNGVKVIRVLRKEVTLSTDQSGGGVRKS